MGRAHRQTRAAADELGGLQAPHIDVSVFARGLLDRVVTRVYFADEQAANAQDGTLRALPTTPPVRP
jgi:Protocatechuate 3,4-dioxygenase beta subunit